MKRRYKVAKLGSGYAYFNLPESAINFAHQQSAASWAQENWTVWDNTKAEVAWLVAADGTFWDPFAVAVEETL